MYPGLFHRGQKSRLIGHLVLQPDALKGASEVYIMSVTAEPGDYPDSACEYILPESDIVIMTASAAINKTLPGCWSFQKTPVSIIIGPTTPLCPELKALGIDRLSGMAVRDKVTFEAWATADHGSPYKHGDVFMI
ncbi:MAG: DUF364 domain-containing protein [Oscillospiraceae bacterium]